MRTQSQIRNKISTFKTQLRKKQIKENFGQDKVRKLQDFIGDIYEYPYQDRLDINDMVNSFSNWCANFTG